MQTLRHSDFGRSSPDNVLRLSNFIKHEDLIRAARTASQYNMETACIGNLRSPNLHESDVSVTAMVLFGGLKSLA